MSAKLNVFVPLTKIDVDTRTIFGVAAIEKLDRSGETFHYETSKPYFEAWSGDIAKSSEGKSVGNLRAMHGKVAAGKLTDIHFNDDAKQIEVVAKVVDDNEWDKCLEGVYSGFSIGGAYVKKWTEKDGDATIKYYTANPAETSLVDYPCIPGATFEISKAAGVETKPFRAAEPVELRARDLCKAASGDPDEEVNFGGDAMWAWQAYVSAAQDAITKDAAAADLAKAAPAAPVHVPAASITNEMVSTRATTLAKAAGDATKWAGFIPQARTELETEAAAPKPVEKIAPAPGSTPSDDGSEEQVWVSKRLPGKTFAKKADMRAALVELDAQELAKSAASPAMAALEDIKTRLAKRDPAAKPEEKPAAAAVIATDKPAPFDLTKIGEIKDRDTLKAALQTIADSAQTISFVGKRAILKKARELGAGDLVPEGMSGRVKASDDLRKMAGADLQKSASLSSVTSFLYLLQDLERAEEMLETDVVVTDYYYSPYTIKSASVEVPKDLQDRFGSLVMDLGDCAAELLDLVLMAMKGEEMSEAMELAAPVLDLMKAGARHNKGDNALVAGIHDAAVKLGASCAAEKLAKVAGAADESDLAKVVEAQRSEFTKTMTDVVNVVTEISKRLKTIEDTPLPSGPQTFRIVEKVDDGAQLTKTQEDIGAALSDEGLLRKLADMAIRGAQRAPMRALTPNT